MQWADSDIDSEGQMNNPYENEDSFSPLACRQRNTAQDDELGHVDPRKALQTTTFRSNGHSIHVFLESKDHDCCADDSSCSFVHKDLRSLAKKWHRLTLSRHSGVLELQSLVEPSAEKGRFAFVYRLPFSEAIDPPAMITLQELMGTLPAEDVPLQSRLRLTKRICSALATLHAGGILHKNITKSSIVYFGDRSDRYQCDSLPYLVNCDFSRPLGDHTSYQFNHKLVRNISQHPACQGVPNEVFTAEYDVYALGVLLLEIGLWSAAIDIFAARNEGVPPTKFTSPVKIQNRLKLAAAMSLPDIMGPGFASLVVRCLSAGAEHLSLEAASELSAASISQAVEGIEEKSLRHNSTNGNLR